MKNSLPYCMLVCLCLMMSCQEPEPTINYQDLDELQQRQSEFALSSMNTPEGLEVELFASEPTLINPTNIAVDEKGRVWVCEARNYRIRLNPGLEKKESGDRILILEDTDGDGKADKHKVFYQGEDINAALGIAVFDGKVIISCSPNVFVFTDTDGDDRPDQRDTLFTGIGGVDHDHAIHAFSFGPDGKLYFNMGNEGRQLMDKHGKPVLDQFGNPINDKGNPYREGMVFRCKEDGSNVEVLGYNFRNPYEVAVDPFGTLWQSDNDDDGNKGTRVNYVMEYGNYGYKDQRTGAGWRAYRPGWHEEIPLRHWHLNDPGVVPNLLQNGAGSPTGMCIYTGDQLPEVFQNQMIHCEPLKNIVRAYPVSSKGAGYEASVVPLLESQDKWFRPSDVAVAPDGSIFVSDWYDPGVGGHKMDDIDRGRIYRIAPKSRKYKRPKVDLSTPEKAISALLNPNQSVFYLAWRAFEKWGAEGEESLLKVWQSPTPQDRAKALWLLSRIDGKTSSYLEEAIKDKDSNIRIMAIRAARQLDPSNLKAYLEQVLEDPSAAVRREVALALKYLEPNQAKGLWATLAQQYDGTDRWYLEALGIPSDKAPDLFFTNWKEKLGDQIHSSAAKDIVWRVHASASVPLLIDYLKDPECSEKDMARYFRALQFKEHPEKIALIEELLQIEHPQQQTLRNLALSQFDAGYIAKNRALKKTILDILPSIEGTSEWLAAIENLNIRSATPKVMAYFLEIPPEDKRLKANAGRLLFDLGGQKVMQNHISSLSEADQHLLIEQIGKINHPKAVELLANLYQKENLSPADKTLLVDALGNSWDGQHLLFDWVKGGQLTGNLKTTAAIKLLNCWNPEIREAAPKYLVAAKSKKGDFLPAIPVLVKEIGQAAKGKEVFNTYCQSCHQINGQGIAFGPDLSAIGEKLAKKALYTSIIYPSAGINFGYEGVFIKSKDNNVFNGYITSKTETELSLKMMGGLTKTFPLTDITSIEPMEHSLMTPNLHEVMEENDLVNLVEFLSTLKENKQLGYNE